MSYGFLFRSVIFLDAFGKMKYVSISEQFPLKEEKQLGTDERAPLERT
jgi:hypothetical protein